MTEYSLIDSLVRSAMLGLTIGEFETIAKRLALMHKSLYAVKRAIVREVIRRLQLAGYNIPSPTEISSPDRLFVNGIIKDVLEDYTADTQQ